MKSSISFFAFLSLLLFADTVAAARKDSGEYWRAVMKDEPMPEVIEGLVRIDAVSSPDKTKCHTPGTSFEIKEEKVIVEDTERTSEGDHEKKNEAFANDFEPRPNISAYGDDGVVKGEKSSSSSTFAKDFEPRPSISAYGEDDVGLKGDKKSYSSEFEPRPNISTYHD